MIIVRPLLQFHKKNSYQANSMLQNKSLLPANPSKASGTQNDAQKMAFADLESIPASTTQKNNASHSAQIDHQ